jgi:hypothetical protein
MNTSSCLLFLLLLTLIIIIAIYKQSQRQIKEKWLDVDMNSFAPMFDTLKFSGLNISKFSNGFTLEDDKTKCVCQCSRKCKPPTATSTTTPTPSSGLGMGVRLNYYPWFAQRE